MKRAILVGVFAAISMLPADLVTLQIGPSAANSLNLYVDKTGLLAGKQHHFVFARYDGTVRFDRDAPARSHVQVTIESKSIECKDTWVSDKDRAKVMRAALVDMLAADKFPQIRFETDSIQQVTPDHFDVAGKLTIRDVTRPVHASVVMKSGNHFEGEAKVRLTDFGLKPPSTALGIVGTKDQMRLSFSLTAEKLSTAVRPPE